MSNDTFIAQEIASNPKQSVWVSASAGSGKTTVLIKRLLRLFLDGVDIGNILCLTYTEVGAVEMKNRLRDEAKKLTILSDDDLKEKLKDLLSTDNVESVSFKKNLAKARQLFLNLVDNPLPLKISTIHSFCQSVLKNFPIEAQISPHFKIITDEDSSNLFTKAYNEFLYNINNKKVSDDLEYNLNVFDSYKYLVEKFSNEESFESLIKNIIKEKIKFQDLFLKVKSKEEIFSKIYDLVFDDYKNTKEFKSFERIVLQDNTNFEKNYKHIIMQEVNNEFLEELKNVYANHSDTTKRRIEKNQNFFILNYNEKLDEFDAYKTLFLGDKDTINGNIFKGEKFKDKHPKIYNEAIRIFNANAILKLYDFYKYNCAIITIAFEINKIYQELKNKAGVVEFDDLIIKVENLLKGNSPWVLYKLDGEISHILIDEAQDTSPLQWSIVNELTSEFFTEGMTEEKLKTFFCVGDGKQSIFSFQGTDINLFKENKNIFQNKIGINNLKLPELNKSFRSCKNILKTVDLTIPNTDGVAEKNQIVEHIAHRQDFGFVEIFPLVKKISKNQKEENISPYKIMDSKNEKNILAKLLARKIKNLIDNEYITEENNKIKYKRKIEPKDILILVRKRIDADNLSKYLNEYNIPISGKDKISLYDNIAIEDLISLLKFVLFPYDDLSLAETLKSPIFNLTDDDLFELCYDRGEKTLFERIKENEKYKNVYSELDEFLNLSKTAMPLEFFDFVLNTKNKLPNFISRLGSETKDIISAFLSQCLSYDNIKIGKSLSDFYEWFSLNTTEIKNEISPFDNYVRIMTVHGSKGLEAPVVFLYNVNSKSDEKETIKWIKLSTDKNENILLPLHKFNNDLTNFSLLLKAHKNLLSKFSKEEEDRLLYVAMTRAKDRLYIMGINDKKEDKKNDKEDNNTWYKSIKNALENYMNKTENEIFKITDKAVIDCGIENFQDEYSICFGTSEVDGEIKKHEEKNNKKITILPNFLNQAIKKKDILKEEKKGISPLENIEENTSFSRGKIIHKLLEHITKYNVENIENFVSKYLSNKIEDANLITDNICKLYNDSKYNFIFHGNNLTETEIAISENNITKILRVDNLVFDNENIWIIDYKTDLLPPEKASPNYIKQLNDYKNAISQIYPNKKIRSGILWITNIKFEEII